MAKIILLTNQAQTAIYFATAISNILPLHLAIMQKARHSKTHEFFQKIRFLCRVIFKEPRQLIRWQMVRKLERKLEARARARYLPGIDSLGDFPCQVIPFDKINSEECVDFLSRQEPYLIIAYGVPILKAPILRVPKIGVINVHGSILPHYRGSQVEFWQLLNEDYDQIGVTVHFVNEGLDTGDIIGQEKTVFEKGDTPFSIRYKNINSAIKLVPKVVQQILSGDLERIKQECETDEPVYRLSMITLELREQLYKKMRLL